MMRRRRKSSDDCDDDYYVDVDETHDGKKRRNYCSMNYWDFYDDYGGVSRSVSFSLGA